MLIAAMTTPVAEVGLAQESLEVARKLAGTVVNRDGQPVAGATLYTHAMAKVDRPLRETKSNEQGEFVITFPPEWPDDVSMNTWVIAKGYALQIVRPTVALQDGLENQPVTISLDRPDLPTFEVQDPNGEPMAHVQVRLAYLNAPTREFSSETPSGFSTYVPDELKEQFTRTTDSEGKATLEFVKKSFVQGVAVSAPQFGEQEIRLNDRTGNTLKLQPVGELTVKVDGDAAADFAGTQLAVNTGNLATHTFRQSVTLDETGQAHLPRVMAGKVRCYLPDREVDGQVLVAAEDVEIKADGSHVFRLKPQKSVQVVGSVLTKDTNKPIAGASLFLSANSIHFSSRSGKTDVEGKVVFRVAPGDYRLSCSLTGVDSTTTDRYYLDSSAVPYRQPPIRIKPDQVEHVLPPILAIPKASVRGQVRNLDSEPIANAIIMLIPSQGTTPILTVETDDSGRFEAEAKESDVKSFANRWIVGERDNSTAGYKEVMSLYARDDDPRSLVLVQAE
jgi:hypothetical protein